MSYVQNKKVEAYDTVMADLEQCLGVSDGRLAVIVDGGTTPRYYITDDETHPVVEKTYTLQKLMDMRYDGQRRALDTLLNELECYLRLDEEHHVGIFPNGNGEPEFHIGVFHDGYFETEHVFTTFAELLESKSYFVEEYGATDEEMSDVHKKCEDGEKKESC